MIVLLLLHLLVGVGLLSASRGADRRTPGRRLPGRRRAVGGHRRLAGRAWRRASSTATCTPSHVDVDPDARRRPRPPPRRVRRPDAAARRRHRRARRRLRRRATSPPDARRRPPARPARAVRRRDGRPRPRRQPARAVRVLGADVGHVVPADRQPTTTTRRPARPRCRRCSSPALGALAMLAGFIVLGQAAGTYRLSAILADPPSAAPRSRSPSCSILVGAFTKSAQYPFHCWLPGGDGRPDAGQRVPPLGDDGQGRRVPRRPAGAGVRRPSTLWRPLVVTRRRRHDDRSAACGPCASTDLKLLLAYGTISQLGFMIAVFGWGTADGDDRRLRACCSPTARSRRPRSWSSASSTTSTAPATSAGCPGPGRLGGRRSSSTVVAAASMAGVPLLFGFIAKEADFDGVRRPGLGGALALAGVVVGSVLTVGLQPPLRRRRARPPGRPERAAGAAAATTARPAAFVAPAAVLAARHRRARRRAPASPTGSSAPRARALDARRRRRSHLALWHGINLELCCRPSPSPAAPCCSSAGRPVGRVAAPTGRCVPPSAGAYRGDAARRQRRRQPGHRGRPARLAADLPRRHPAHRRARARARCCSPARGGPAGRSSSRCRRTSPIAAVLIGLALAAAIVRRRFAGALFLGMVGYAMAGLFVAQGAPDLALTQVAIETLSTVLFVLVLRRLPDRFETHAGAARRALRIAIATVVGAARVRVHAGRRRRSTRRRPVSDDDDRRRPTRRATAATSST